MLKPIIIRKKQLDIRKVEQFQKELLREGFDTTTLITKLLLNRGIDSVDQANRFISPKLSSMYDPYLLKDMNKAVDTIQQHIQLGNAIVVYGDYDVDGITSTTILYKMLKECGGNTQYYIPDRIVEGYGINSEAITKLANQGTKLIISVDTGITAVEQVEVGKSLGLDIIITDHHECQESIPRATAVINPKQPDCEYPFKFLAGVGVTFKLIQALERRFQINPEFVLKLLEIVAVGTIADIVPLIDENRIFVSHAFKSLKKPCNMGLKALMEVSGVDGDKINSSSIGFQIGPRLNAAGRLGDAKRGVALFLSEDEEEAIIIAKALNEENQKRREMEDKILKEADQIIQESIDMEKTKILVVASSHWHHGVIGIVASRICEKYYRPTILLAVEEGIASGSARSVEGFSVFDALMSCKDLFNKFGGHEMAAGMSLEEDKIGELSSRLNSYASLHMEEETLIKKVNVEEVLLVPDITVELIESLAILEPYGMGNEEPKFRMDGLISSTTLMGQEKNHFKLNLMDINASSTNEFSSNNIPKGIDIISFYGSDYDQQVTKNMLVSVIGSLHVNAWKSYKNPQVFLKSIYYEDKFSIDLEALWKLAEDLFGTKAQSDMEKIVDWAWKIDRRVIIQREDCIVTFKGLKRLSIEGEHQLSLSRFDRLFETNNEMSFLQQALQTLLILKVFEELALIELSISSKGIISFQLNTAKKVELEKSTLYNRICFKK